MAKYMIYTVSSLPIFIFNGLSSNSTLKSSSEASTKNFG